MTYNLRSSALPTNGIVMDITNTTLPFSFSHETVLFDKYPKGIPNLCTQPGGSIGAHTHDETSATNNHSHTSTLGSHGHSTITSGASSTAISGGSCGAGTAGKTSSHTHTWTPCSVSGTPTVCSGDAAHTHPASQPTEPTNQTIRYIKKTESSIRASNVPVDKVVWYGKTIASLPTPYAIETSMANNRFYKGVPNGCTAPGTQAGSNCHTHPASSTTHTHPYSVASHTHAKPTNTATGSGANDGGGCPAVSIAIFSHTHATSGTTITATDAGTTGTDTSHTHASATHLPLHRELLPIKRSTISLRNKRLPLGSVIMWLENLSTIPIGYQVANGTNGTICTLDRYVRAVPNGSTDPGTGAGATTHQHATSNTHTHSFNHKHALSGTYSGGATTNAANVGPADMASGAHTHTNPANTGNAVGTANAGGAHQHATTNNDPGAIRVAYIERIA